MSNAEIPRNWADRLVSKGFTDGRFKEDVPSLRALASAMGVHTSTVSKIIQGKSTPTASNVTALVNQLGGDVAEWLGVEYHGPWVPPDDSVLLDPRQRKALEELIVSITSRKGSGDVESAAQKIDDEAGTQTSTQKTDGPDDDDLGGVTQFRPRRPSGPPNADELSEPDASIKPAADDVIPDDDEELGGSDQRE